jgi:hypothetical protein
MAHDLRKLPTNSNQRPPAAAMFSAHDLVQMKPPAHPIRGEVVDGEPLVAGGVRYWRVAWKFGDERRVTWSPESAILAR